MKKITITVFKFQRSLPKQVNNFTTGIVPQLNGIELPVSRLLVICVEWERKLCTLNDSDSLRSHFRFSHGVELNLT